MISDDIPIIGQQFNLNKCTKHNNLYIDRSFPCPHPDCLEGLNSNEFIIKDSNSIYIRKRWLDLDGNKKYMWIDKMYPFIYIDNIIYDEMLKISNSERHTSIYHYTSLDTLYKILESNELWLTEWKCTNDKMEIQHGLEIVNKFNTNKLNLEKIVNKNNYFISSFSYEIGKKTLFDEYAEKAEGVAIEFNMQHQYIPRDKSFWYKNSEFMKLLPIIYDKEIQEKIIQYAFYIYDTVKLWIEESPDIYNPFSNKLHSKKKRIKHLTSSFSKIIEEIISFFKDDSFSDEREIRWLYRYDSKFIKKNKFKNKIRNKVNKYYFTTKDAHYMSYDTVYNIDKVVPNIKLPIKSIILGSRVKNKEQIINDIKKKCNLFDFNDVEIKVSNIPYQ